MAKDARELKSILATDCGSTTTKAILIEKRGRHLPPGRARRGADHGGGAVRGRDRAACCNAIMEVEELAGRQDPRRRADHHAAAAANEGVDIYVSTSSAGGGLQMMVTGVVKSMTGESAERAALGAGAIVMDMIATNDGRLPHEKIRAHPRAAPRHDPPLRRHRRRHDDARGRAGRDHRRGRPEGRGWASATSCRSSTPATRTRAPEIEATLGDKTALVVTDNLRPALERENLMPGARTRSTTCSWST